MNISFHTGKSAMIAQGKAIDIYGNNIANINTNGYQTLRPTFADCVYVKERSPEPDWQTGHGTYIQKTDLMFAESHFVETERPQDMAIVGEGWFAVEDRYGDVNYTRDGCFGMTQDPDSGDWYLISSSGEYVLNYDRERIVIPFVFTDNGTETAEPDWAEVKREVGVFQFPNPFGLEAGANNRYVQTLRSGEAVACREMGDDGEWIYTMEKIEGALITSNVNLADMMVKLIEAQRSYQISSRVVTTSDELARIANNLR